MNKALKKYKKKPYRETRLCPLNWTIDILFQKFGHVVITLSPKNEGEL